MGDIYVGENITYFDGLLRVWLSDGSLIETPFWDKIEVDPSCRKNHHHVRSVQHRRCARGILEGFEARGFCLGVRGGVHVNTHARFFPAIHRYGPVAMAAAGR